MGEVTVQESWETLEDELGDAMETLREAEDLSDYQRAHKELIAALETTGFDLDEARGMSLRELKGTIGHWVLLYGLGREDYYDVFVIPEDALDEALRRALDDLHGRVVAFGETCHDAPEQWEAWALVALATGRAKLADFVADEELRAERGLPPLDRARAKQVAGRWSSYAASEEGELDAAELRVKVIGVTHLREG